MLICFVVILYTTNAVYPSPEIYYINLTILTQNSTSTTKQNTKTDIRQSPGYHKILKWDMLRCFDKSQSEH